MGTAVSRLRPKASPITHPTRPQAIPQLSNRFCGQTPTFGVVYIIDVIAIVHPHYHPASLWPGWYMKPALATTMASAEI
jgi:hypothetical protein